MSVAARMLYRRWILVIALVGLFLGTMIIASAGLTEMCPEKGGCHQLTHVKESLPSFRWRSDTAHGKPLRKPEGKASGPKHRGPAPGCAGFPDTSSILVSMKTGASEAFARLPTQALTTLRCLPEYFVFGDMKQNIAGYHVRDSLETVLDEVKNDNKDFDLYFRQQQCLVDQEACNKHADAASAGWSLDKYKNIHIAEKAYRMRPNYDWYMFVDADTYVVWPTVVTWMKKLNHSDRYYLGSRAYVADTPFGHGGSGYIVSKAAMQEFLDGKEKVANRWDHRVPHECCGDYLFALALKNETGIEVNNTWPTINGEKPYTLGFNDDQWCHPLATMHHLNSEEISMLDDFERERRYASPLLIKDVFHRYVKPHLEAQKQDWDNLSDDTWYLDTETPGKHEDWEVEKAKKEDLSEHEKKAHHSANDCRDACQQIDDCMQWSFHKGICRASGSIKHGKPAKPSDKEDEKCISGWNLDKINEWVDKHDDCDEMRWPKVGTEE